MQDKNQNTYDTIPYESYPYPQSSPEHLRTIGVLFGMNPPALENARILELGCAAGGNLIPTASYYPKSSCVGVDLSNVQINNGQAFIKKLGLKNIELKSMSITDIDPSMGKFDYIISHGVFSWVPENVREKMLEICGSMLTDNGIAYISYNILPGWNMVRSIRDMMLYHSAGFADEKDKVAQARLLLNFIIESTEGQKSPYADFLRHEANILSNQPDHYIRHDHMEENNFQLYFNEFMSHASSKGLQYLGDASLSSMFIGNLPKKASEKLAEVKDIVRVEQYMDFLNNRRFRSTLLCKKSVQLNRSLTFNDIDKFYIQMKAQPERPEAEVNINDSLETLKFYFNNNKDVNISTSSRNMKAILYSLAENTATFLKTNELYKLAAKKLDKPNLEELKAEFSNNAMKLVLSGYITISSEPPRYVVRSNEKPKVSSLVRAQCEHNSGFWITNQKHEKLAINIFDKYALRYLDGNHDIEDLVERVSEHVKKGEITVSKDNQKIEDEKEIRKELTGVIQQLKAKLEKSALLVS